MVVKVKKNKTPKASKSKKGKTMLQKQTVSQNVKVNIYKSQRIPKDFKLIQQNKASGAGGTPNIRALPQSVFHSTVIQPSSTLYKEQFGYAKPVNVSPFERLLASEAVEDNRQLETATLRNALESSRLKSIERRPIEAPVRRGESEEARFLARATASKEDNRQPFKVASRQQAGTLGVSFRDRISEGEYLQERRAQPEDESYRVLPQSTVESSIESAISEASTGQRNYAEGESQTFRTDTLGEGFGGQLGGASTIETPQSGEDHGHTQILGEPSIPDRLVDYLAESGTSGDLLESQREEIVPLTEGQIQAGQIDLESRGRGRPQVYSDPEHERGRKATAQTRAIQAFQAKYKAQREARLEAQAPDLQTKIGKALFQNLGEIVSSRKEQRAIQPARPVKTLVEHFGGKSKVSGSHRGEGAI
jgi:hypothetical protein